MSRDKDDSKDMVIVCGIVHDGNRDSEVILIEKNRPEWQKGCYNLVGGHIKTYENPDDAAAREFGEETNLYFENHQFELVGSMNFGDVSVYTYTIRVDGKYVKNNMKSMTDEKVVSMLIHEVLVHPKIINNLRYIIPKCLVILDGWRDF